jgi:hypothetical protein
LILGASIAFHKLAFADGGCRAVLDRRRGH